MRLDPTKPGEDLTAFYSTGRINRYICTAYWVQNLWKQSQNVAARDQTNEVIT